MNCFNHRERPALGVCKSCGKGLCEECLQEVPNGLACKAKCEERVAIINKMIDVYPQALAASRNAFQRNAVLLLGLGTVSLLLAFLLFISNGLSSSLFLWVIGLVFLLIGISAIRRKNQLPS